MTSDDMSSKKDEAKRLASCWLQQQADERESLLRNRRAQSDLNRQDGYLEKEGCFLSEDPSKPWTSVYTNLPTSQSSLSGHMKDVSRQRAVIATLRKREADGRSTGSIQWMQASGVECATPVQNATEDCLAVPTPNPASIPAQATDSNDKKRAAKVLETVDYDMLMKELQQKREQLVELVSHQQGSPAAGGDNDTVEETGVISPVYQACKPSHVKHLGGDLYSKMTPEELDKELAKLRAAIAALEQRTAAMM